VFYSLLPTVSTRQVGKTAIISQFLYDSFICGYRETVDEMYHGEFEVGQQMHERFFSV
jgi:hypothetical protein